MSELLRTLLPALEAAARRSFRPTDLDTIIVHNTGAIPPVRTAADPPSSAPGFNVIVAERGRPIYFCKCRPAGDPTLAHEAMIGEILGRNRLLAPHVAATHLRRASAMDVLVLRRLPGRPYYEPLVKQSEDEWLSSVERIIGLVEEMSSHVASTLPLLRGGATLSIAAEGEWALAALTADHGLAARRAKLLAAALAGGGEVTPRLQHGDLWPPNVLLEGTSWYVLDLELFGRVRVPLYDLLHMLHICSEVRRAQGADARTWIERLVTRDVAEAGSLDLVRRSADRQGLSPSSTFAAVVYYAVDIAARVKARGAWTADWREYVAQVERLADLVGDGVATPERLFTSGRG